MTNPQHSVALITGASKRIGAEICRQLHQRGYNIVLHYQQSELEAGLIKDELNLLRANSCITFAADLNSLSDIKKLAENAVKQWQRIDLLVNNASRFYPVEVGSVEEQHWDDLLGSNLKGAFFLAQELSPTLKKHQGNIINIIDIYAKHPLKSHSVYCIAKAGLVAMTQSLALELGPDIRVNGISPGAILWPVQADTQTDNNQASAQQQNILNKTALQRSGSPLDIANTLVFLAMDAPFITGQIIAVDGGRLSC